MTNPFYNPALSAQQDKPRGTNAMAIGGAALEMGANIAGAVNEAKDINTTSPEAIIDATGQPQYNLGQFSAEVGSINKKDYGKGLIGQGAMSGAKAGMAVGGPIGAGIGAVGGAIVGLVGRGIARRKAERQKRKAEQNLKTSQQEFNTANTTFQQQQLAKQAYNDSESNINQMQNLYNIPNTFV
jgi:hypothetical protein